MRRVGEGDVCPDDGDEDESDNAAMSEEGWYFEGGALALTGVTRKAT